MQLGEVSLQEMGFDVEANGYVVELRDGVVEADTLVIGFLDVVGTDSHVTV